MDLIRAAIVTGMGPGECDACMMSSMI